MGCSHPGGTKTRSSEPVVEVAPWKLLHTSTIEHWAQTDAVRLGFEFSRDWANQKSQLQPWCTAGCYYEAKLPAPAEGQDLSKKYSYTRALLKHPTGSCTVPLSRNYRHSISAKLTPAPWMYVCNVVAARDHVVLLQIITTDGASEFHLIDITKREILGVYRERFYERAYLYEGFISPDHSHVVLKPNLLFALKFRINAIDDCLKVLTRAPRTSQFEVISEHFRDVALDLIVTFDPRRRHTHIAVANLTKRRQHVLCIYNLKKYKIVQKTFGPQYQRTQNLTFSPDGDFLAALTVTYIFGTSMSPQRFNFQGVMVYSTQVLSLLHCIPSFGTSSVDSLTPASLFPTFSNTGNFIAFGSGSGAAVTRVEVYKMPAALNLQSLCRAKFRLNFTARQIEHFTMSQQTRDFINYKPLYD